MPGVVLHLVFFWRRSLNSSDTRVVNVARETDRRWFLLACKARPRRFRRKKTIKTTENMADDHENQVAKNRGDI